MKYTLKQIAECKTYLHYGFKNGYLDLEVCEDIIERKAWDEVYEMMDKGDYLADSWEGGE